MTLKNALDMQKASLEQQNHVEMLPELSYWEQVKLIAMHTLIGVTSLFLAFISFILIA